MPDHPIDPCRLAMRYLSLAVVVLLAGCGDDEAAKATLREQEAIRRVLAIDHALSQVRNKGLNEHTDADTGAAAGHAYLDAMNAVDLRDLPEDVRSAYTKHIAAWAATTELVEHYSGITGAFKSGFDGDEYVKARLLACEKQVNDTWAQVQAACRAHGVDVPAGH